MGLSVTGPVLRPGSLPPNGTSVLTIILRPLHSRGWFLLVWWRNWSCHRSSAWTARGTRMPDPSDQLPNICNDDAEKPNGS